MTELKPCRCGKPPQIIKSRHYTTIKASCGICEDEVGIYNTFGSRTLEEIEERARVMWNNMIERGTF